MRTDSTLPTSIADASPRTLYGSRDLARSERGWELPGDGPAVSVWRLR